MIAICLLTDPSAASTPARSGRRRRRRVHTALILLCCSLLHAEENAAKTSIDQVLASNDGAYYVRYTIEPTPLKLQQTFAIKVAVFTDAALTQPARDISLTVDGRMPQHRHGMNTEPVIQTLAPGVFQVEGMLFHMAGRWQLIFDMTRDGETVRAQTALEL